VLARVQDALGELYTSVLGQDVGLETVLRQIATTAIDLIHARYGVLVVLSEDGGRIVEFIPVGLTGAQEAATARLGWPKGRGLLAHLRQEPSPLRVASISEHPKAIGLPAGHPKVKTLLGVTIMSRGRTFGNLYVSNRRDGQPFDEHDEAMIVALAGAAGLAIDHARLFGQVRSEAEEFQRLLLPQLPDLRPIETAALYRPATAGRIGGDWYDAIRLSDDSCALVIGDVGGHSMQAAAEMSQIRAMLRTLLYERRGSPSAVLCRLDRMLQATTDIPIATVCLALLQPAGMGWRLHWSTAGHPAPLLLAPSKPGRYLVAEPGLPLGVDCDTTRPDQRDQLPGGATLVFFTDGLVECRRHDIDEGLATLARLATQHAGPCPERLCQALANGCPGDGSDDIAMMALQLPALPAVSSGTSPAPPSGRAWRFSSRHPRRTFHCAASHRPAPSRYKSPARPVLEMPDCLWAPRAERGGCSLRPRVSASWTWSWLLIFAGQGRSVECEPGPVVPAQDLHDFAQLRRYRVQADRPTWAGFLAGPARTHDGAEPGQITELDAAQVDVYVAVVVECGQALQEQRVTGLIDVAGDDQPGLIVGLGDAQRLFSHGAARRKPPRPRTRSRAPASPPVIVSAAAAAPGDTAAASGGIADAAAHCSGVWETPCLRMVVPVPLFRAAWPDWRSTRIREHHKTCQ